MKKVCIAAALSVALTTLAPSAAEAQEPPERLSLAFETAGLAYGLAVGSPRISVAASVPIQEHWSIQVSPAAAWGGDAGSSSVELALPVALRAAIRLGPLAPYAASRRRGGLGTPLRARRHSGVRVRYWRQVGGSPCLEAVSSSSRTSEALSCSRRLTAAVRPSRLLFSVASGSVSVSNWPL